MFIVIHKDLNAQPVLAGIFNTFQTAFTEFIGATEDEDKAIKSECGRLINAKQKFEAYTRASKTAEPRVSTMIYSSAAC